VHGYVETGVCPSLPACPVNCVGAFGAWDTCSATCGTGVRTRAYAVTTPAANGGLACGFADGYVETSVCPSLPACPVNCVGAFGPWNSCSATCGVSVRTRTYSVTTPAANGGAACALAAGYVESASCPDLPPCPVNCGGSFGAWSACSATCGAGTRTHTYTVTSPATNGGAACPYADGYVETAACPSLPACAGKALFLFFLVWFFLTPFFFSFPRSQLCG
jgi:hypothetical protein